MTKPTFNINGVSVPGNLYEAYNCFKIMEDKEKIEFLKLAIESIQRTPVEESVVTAHDTKIERATRNTIAQNRHDRGKRPVARSKDPLAKTDLKRGRKSNNDGSKPGRGNLIAKDESVGQILNVEGVFGDALKFIQENYGKEVTEGQVKGVSDKLALQNIVNRMMAFHRIGWKDDDGVLTNGNVQADPEVWSVKEGVLVNSKTGTMAAQFDWLYALREMVSGAIKSELSIIEDVIKNGKI